MTIEEWRTIDDWPGYEVSNLGRVRSWKRLASGMTEPRVLAMGTSVGYLSVGLGSARAGQRKTIKVHWLVAAAFLGPRPEGQQIAHNDGNRLNARADNLRYTTQAGNDADKKVHGTLLRGQRVAGAVLTDDQVLSIYADPRPDSIIAAEYGIRSQTVGKIKLGHRWGWLTSGEPDPPRRTRDGSKLTWDQVQEIRAAYVRGLNRWRRGNAAELARQFGVSISYLTSVATGVDRPVNGGVA